MNPMLPPATNDNVPRIERQRRDGAFGLMHGALTLTLRYRASNDKADTADAPAASAYANSDGEG
jgi:hypothetical protein